LKRSARISKKQIVVERNHFGVGEHAHSLQNIQCSPCSKRWKMDLSVTLAKSAPALSSNLAELRVQVRGQLDVDDEDQCSRRKPHSDGPANEV
jgi:hypothetical protein